MGAGGLLAARERGDTLQLSPNPRSAAARRGPSAALLEGSWQEEPPNPPLPKGASPDSWSQHSRIRSCSEGALLWPLERDQHAAGFYALLKAKPCGWVGRVDAPD